MGVTAKVRFKKKITVALRRFKKNKNDTELVNKTAPEKNVHDLEGL